MPRQRKGSSPDRITPHLTAPASLLVSRLAWPGLLPPATSPLYTCAYPSPCSFRLVSFCSLSSLALPSLTHVSSPHRLVGLLMVRPASEPALLKE